MKLSFFKLLKKAFKDTKNNYDKLKREEKLKSHTLNVKSDWYLIESFIQQINDNPELRVKVTLSDGTVINMNTYKAKEKSEYSRLEY